MPFAGFVAPLPLARPPPRRAVAAARAPPPPVAKRSGRRVRSSPARRGGGGGGGGKRGGEGAGKKREAVAGGVESGAQAAARASAEAGAAPGAEMEARGIDETALMEEFVEEVAVPLRPGLPKTIKDGKDDAAKKGFDWEREFGEGRGLDLLRKATWVGVGALVFTFFFVHLVLVGDWVGKSPPPSLH